jgi:pimeloyl-ACP methyl ester carboxylesterase
MGPYMDYALQYDGMAPELDLGDAFRRNPASDVPVLVFSGTLDGRTDIVSQREAVSDLRRVTIITVCNAGHNLFDQPTVEMLETIDRFMHGKAVHDATITVELPNMSPGT